MEEAMKVSYQPQNDRLIDNVRSTTMVSCSHTSES